MNGSAAVRKAIHASVLVCVALTISSCDWLDWSPDGRRVVVSWPAAEDTSVLRVVDVATGAYATVPNSTGALSPSWSPNGRWIAFHGGSGPGEAGVYLYDVEARRTRRIASGLTGPLTWREDSARLLAMGSGVAVALTVPDGFPTWECNLDGTNVGPVEVVQWVDNTDNVVLLKNQNLFLIEGAQLTQLTTTDDVIGFVIYDGGRKLMWARAIRNTPHSLVKLYYMTLKHRSVRRLELPRQMGQGILLPAGRATLQVSQAVLSPKADQVAICAYSTGGRADVHIYTAIPRSGQVRHVWTVQAKPGQSSPPIISLRYARDGRSLACVAVSSEASYLATLSPDSMRMRVLTVQRHKKHVKR